MAKKKQIADSPADGGPAPASPGAGLPFNEQLGSSSVVGDRFPHPQEPWYARWAASVKWWFQQGWKTTPAFRYIQFLVSLCAGLTIVLFIFRLSPLTALIGTIVTLWLATVVSLFAQVAAKGGPKTLLGQIFLAFMAITFMASVAMLWSWFFFEVPPAVGRFLGTGISKGAEEEAASAPDDLSFTPCESADDANLPDALFGPPGDDVGMLRQWMRTIDSGALKKLKAEVGQAKLFWLLTNEFPKPYKGFDVRVYTGTTEKVITCAFLVTPGISLGITPLARTAESGPPGPFMFRGSDKT